MSDQPRRNPRLRDRDYEILEHVMRYRLTTPEVLHRKFFSDSDRNAVSKVTSRLCATEFLVSYPLFGSNVYFTLGKRGATVMGVPRRLLGSLGPQALYREYGTLAFCCLGEIAREKLRVRELQEKHPDCLARGLDAAHYYLDQEEGTVRLGYIWVEAAGAVDHIVRKVLQEIIENRRHVPTLRTYIDEGRFVVAIVTLSPDKRQAISAALKQVRTPAFFRVEVVPELMNLLPGAHHV